jgi:hypothetical protein
LSGTVEETEQQVGKRAGETGEREAPGGIAVLHPNPPRRPSLLHSTKIAVSHFVAARFTLMHPKPLRMR